MCRFKCAGRKVFFSSMSDIGMNSDVDIRTFRYRNDVFQSDIFVSDIGYRRHWDRCRCPPMALIESLNLLLTHNTYTVLDASTLLHSYNYFMSPREFCLFWTPHYQIPPESVLFNGNHDLFFNILKRQGLSFHLSLMLWLDRFKIKVIGTWHGNGLICNGMVS